MSLFELKSFPDAVLAETGIMLLPFQGFSLHFEQIKTFLKKINYPVYSRYLGKVLVCI